MKKIAKMLAVVVVVVLLMFTIVACGEVADNGSNTNDPIVDDITNPDADTFLSQDAVSALLTNYSFKYETTFYDDGEATILNFVDKRSENAWLYSFDDTTFLADKATSSLYLLNFEDQTGLLMDLEDDNAFEGWGSVLFGWHLYATSLKKVSTATVVGRECNVYKYKLGQMTCTYYIDNQYDLCLKYEILASGIADIVSFCFTEFNIGGVTTESIIGLLDGYEITDLKNLS